MFDHISALLLIRAGERHIPPLSSTSDTGTLSTEGRAQCVRLTENRHFAALKKKVVIVITPGNACAVESAQVLFRPQNATVLYATVASLWPFGGLSTGPLAFTDDMIHSALRGIGDVAMQYEGVGIAIVTQMCGEPGAGPEIACAIYRALGFHNAADRLAEKGVRHGQAVLISRDKDNRTQCELIG